MENTHWLQVPQTLSLSANDLEQEVRKSYEQKIQSKVLSQDEEEGICRAQPSVSDGEVELSDELLERLRAMCQLWEVDILPPNKVTSHRPIIGPIIVGIKKALFPLLKVLLKDMIRQQRDFNAATVRFVAELASKKKE